MNLFMDENLLIAGEKPEFRKQIIELIEVPPDGYGNYERMKNCFKPALPDKVDAWFKGVVNALYYRPNHNLFILLGNNVEANRLYFRSLTPDTSKYYSEESELSEEEPKWPMYNTLVWNLDWFKKTTRRITKDNFRAIPTDKRLTSYCTVATKWNFPVRYSFITHEVKYFDVERWMNINKLELWREIYNLFNNTFIT